MPFMQESRYSPWCISYTFAGIPTIIHPSSWVVLLLMGIMVSGSNEPDLFQVILFAVAGMLCLLVHEYGHALVCRFLGGGASVVEIATMGGMTRCDYPPPTRLGHIMMVMAGPTASLLLGLAGGLVFGWMAGDVCAGLLFSLLFPVIPDLLMSNAWLLNHVSAPVIDMLENGQIPPYLFYAFNMLFVVCVWWSFFNMLPIFPLDGGQTLQLVTRSNFITARVGVTVALFLLVYCVLNLMFMMALIAAYFLYLNFQYMRSTRD